VCSAATDRRIARAHAVEATDPARADRMWQALDRQTVNAALWVPLVNPHQIELVSRRLGNYQYNALVGFIADQAWLH